MVLLKKLIANKIPDIANLATKTGLNTVENEIPSISNLVKKTDYDHKHDKYITTSKFNTLATNAFNTRIAQVKLITKTDFDSKLSNLNRKITANKTKHLLVESELNKLKTW